jgi:hypothetical protein
MNGVSTLDGDKNFSQTSRPTEGPNQPSTRWVLGALSSGTKRQGRQADYIPPPVPRLRMSGGAILLLQVFAFVTRIATTSRLMCASSD